MDVCTQRIRSASKIVNQLKFIQATLLDTNTKVKQWNDEAGIAELVSRAKALREQGVEEDRLMDTSLQLGDDASAVRMIYGCLDRMHMVALAVQHVWRRGAHRLGSPSWRVMWICCRPKFLHACKTTATWWTRPPMRSHI